jgi:hypothetical protein
MLEERKHQRAAEKLDNAVVIVAARVGSANFRSSSSDPTYWSVMT